MIDGINVGFINKADNPEGVAGLIRRLGKVVISDLHIQAPAKAALSYDLGSSVGLAGLWVRVSYQEKTEAIFKR